MGKNKRRKKKRKKKEQRKVKCIYFKIFKVKSIFKNICVLKWFGGLSKLQIIYYEIFTSETTLLSISKNKALLPKLE